MNLSVNPMYKLYYNKSFKRQDIDNYFKNLIVTKAKEDSYLYISWPSNYDYYVDPKLHYYINAVFPSILPTQIPYYFFQHSKGVLALNDSLSLYSWALWLESQSNVALLKNRTLIIINFDDYLELLSPLAYIHNKNLYNILDNSLIDFFKSDKILDTIGSGAISQGTAYLPFLYKAQAIFKRIVIIHIMPEYKNISLKYAKLSITSYRDNFLDQQIERLSLKKQLINITQSDTVNLLEITTSCINDLSNIIFSNFNDLAVFLDIDFSYFANRYRQDSNWKILARGHDPSWFEIQMTIKRSMALLKQHVSLERLENINFFTSPGYYPSEYWENTLELLRNSLNININYR